MTQFLCRKCLHFIQTLTCWSVSAITMRQQIKLCREWLCVLCFCHHKSCSSAIFICEKKRSYVFIKHLDQQASQYHLVNNHPFLKLGGRRMLFWDRTFITTYKYMYNSSWSSWSTVCNDAHLCRLQEHGSHIQYPMPPAQPLSTWEIVMKKTRKEMMILNGKVDHIGLQ